MTLAKAGGNALAAALLVGLSLSGPALAIAAADSTDTTSTTASTSDSSAGRAPSSRAGRPGSNIRGRVTTSRAPSEPAAAATVRPPTRRTVPDTDNAAAPATDTVPDTVPDTVAHVSVAASTPVPALAAPAAAVAVVEPAPPAITSAPSAITSAPPAAATLISTTPIASNPPVAAVPGAIQTVIRSFIDSASDRWSTRPSGPLTDFVAGALQLLRRWLPEAGRRDYAAILQGSNWYVPINNQLAYGANVATQFSNPIAIGDQTTWGCQLGVNGCTTASTAGFTVTSAPGSAVTTFVGSATGQLAIGPVLTTSYLSIAGSVSPTGATVMVFTPTDSDGTPTGGASTVGFGQFDNIGHVPAMVMQMISGSSFLVTHWAYMLPYSGPSSAAHQAIPKPPSRANPWYAWMKGTTWSIVDPALFGTSEPGTFTITDYSGGYLIGSGQGPASNPITFTQLGSITTRGKVLFNTMVDGSTTQVSSYGELRGFPRRSAATLAGYDPTTGQPTGSQTVLTRVLPKLC